MVIVAAVLVAIAAGSFWLQRVAFSPSPDSGVAYSVMADDEIRGLVSTIVAGATAPTLAQSSAQLREDIEVIARIPAGAALMRQFLGDAHARVIGDSDERVLITPEEQVTIVRNEAVADDDPITLPVQQVGSLSFLNSALSWFTLATLGLGVVIGLAGLFLRPERGEGTFALGVFFASLAGSLVVFGFLVPQLVLPALADDVWMGLFPQLANHHRNLTLILAAVALALTAAIVFGTGGRRGDRRQSPSSYPMARYSNDRGWSS